MLHYSTGSFLLGINIALNITSQNPPLSDIPSERQSKSPPHNISYRLKNTFVYLALSIIQSKTQRSKASNILHGSELATGQNMKKVTQSLSEP